MSITGLHKDIPKEAGANSYQPGGTHYIKYKDLQPWDIVTAWGLDFFQGNILKYIARWKDKGGLDDLYKAQHYLAKYIEVEKAKQQAEEVRKTINEVNTALDAWAKVQADKIAEEEDKRILGELCAPAGRPLDATGDNRKGLVEVDGIKFNPQRNYEMIGGEGVYVPSETVERSKEILDTLNSWDKVKYPYSGVPMGVATSFGGVQPAEDSFPTKLTKGEVASLLEDVEPLDKMEDRLVYEPMAKELGVSVQEARQLEQDAKEVIARYPVDPMYADIAKDYQEPKGVELPHVDGNGSPVEDAEEEALEELADEIAQGPAKNDDIPF